MNFDSRIKMEKQTYQRHNQENSHERNSTWRSSRGGSGRKNYSHRKGSNQAQNPSSNQPKPRDQFHHHQSLLTNFQADYVKDWDWSQKKNWQLWLESPMTSIL